MALFLPNMLIGGAPKCGTSSLHFWLAHHPEALGSKRKDSFFLADEISRFNKGLSFINDGLEGYVKLFNPQHAEGKKVIFESSSTYLYCNNALEQAKVMDTKPTAIFILREPAARIYSKFKFNKYKLKNFTGDFKEWCSLGGEFGSGFHFEESEYHNYLQNWIDTLGKERVGVFLFEELISDKVAFMKKVAEFLKIDPSFYDDFDFFHRNETVKLKNTKLHRLGLKIQPLVPIALQERIIPLYMKLNSGKMPGKLKEEKELIEELKQKFKMQNKALQSQFKHLDLKGWVL